MRPSLTIPPSHSFQLQEMKRMEVTLLLLPLLLLLFGRETDGCVCYMENWTCRSGFDEGERMRMRGQENVLAKEKVWDHF